MEALNATTLFGSLVAILESASMNRVSEQSGD